MSAIQYALKKIRRSIREEVLIAAMTVDLPPNSMYASSIDDMITSQIIKEIVLADADIIGGVEVLISLDSLRPVRDDYNTAVYRIPKEFTHNREIVSVLGMGSTALTGPGGYYGGIGPSAGSFGNSRFGGGCFNGNYLTDQWRRVYNSHQTPPVDYNAGVSLIGPNTVLVYGLQFYSGNALAIRVLVSNEENFNNIQRRYHIRFGDMCVLAAKMYIHNKLDIKIESGELQGGQELGRFKSIVDSYESAEEDYNTFVRDVWGRIAFMNDTDRMGRYLSSINNSNF